MPRRSIPLVLDSLVKDNVLDGLFQCKAIESRHGCGDADQSRKSRWDSSLQSKMLKDFQVTRRNNVMSLIDQDHFESGGIKFVDSSLRVDALHRSNCNIGEARGM